MPNQAKLSKDRMTSINQREHRVDKLRFFPVNRHRANPSHEPSGYRLFHFLLCSLASVLVGCGQMGDSGGERGRGLSETQHAAASVADVYFPRCGDRRFSRHDAGNYWVVEVRNVTWSVTERPLSEADRLNGVENTIAVRFKMPTNRTINFRQPSASEWRTDGYRISETMHATARKKNGVWEREANIYMDRLQISYGVFWIPLVLDASPESPLTQMSCEELNAIVDQVDGVSPRRSSVADPAGTLHSEALGSATTRAEADTERGEVGEATSYGLGTIVGQVYFSLDYSPRRSADG